jgi:hypothetical protein
MKRPAFGEKAERVVMGIGENGGECRAAGRQRSIRDHEARRLGRERGASARYSRRRVIERRIVRSIK